MQLAVIGVVLNCAAKHYPLLVLTNNVAKNLEFQGNFQCQQYSNDF